MWVKQKWTTHLGMWYTTYYDLGHGLWLFYPQGFWFKPPFSQPKIGAPLTLAGLVPVSCPAGSRVCRSTTLCNRIVGLGFSWKPLRIFCISCSWLSLLQFGQILILWLIGHLVGLITAILIFGFIDICVAFLALRGPTIGVSFTVDFPGFGLLRGLRRQICIHLLACI